MILPPEYSECNILQHKDRVSFLPSRGKLSYNSMRDSVLIAEHSSIAGEFRVSSYQWAPYAVANDYANRFLFSSKFTVWSWTRTFQLYSFTRTRRTSRVQNWSNNKRINRSEVLIVNLFISGSRHTHCESRSGSIELFVQVCLRNCSLYWLGIIQSSSLVTNIYLHKQTFAWEQNSSHHENQVLSRSYSSRWSSN